MIRVLFSYGDDEYLPVLLGFGHNLKEENLCEGELIELESAETSKKYKIETQYRNKNTQIFLTYENTELIDCHIKLDDNKVHIKDYRVYCSLQIGDYCYDNIHAFRIPENISYE
jgi:hypothetical protein